MYASSRKLIRAKRFLISHLFICSNSRLNICQDFHPDCIVFKQDFPFSLVPGSQFLIHSRSLCLQLLGDIKNLPLFWIQFPCPLFFELLSIAVTCWGRRDSKLLPYSLFHHLQSFSSATSWPISLKRLTPAHTHPYRFDPLSFPHHSGKKTGNPLAAIHIC